MINGVTFKVNVDDYILNTLKEDITSEDVSTNAVMPEDKQGKAELICKQDGIICGLGIFERTFELLDKTARFPSEMACFDSSPGRIRRTAVWISRVPTVLLWFTRAR